jgi:hypothetical protein
VTFTLTSSNPAEGTVAPTSITFTPADWNVEQTVTLTGVNDARVDGDQPWTVQTSATTSADPIFDAIEVDDLSATNTDDDVAGITVTPTAGLGTTEAGGTATFEVVLTSEPSADVTVPVASSNAGEGTADMSSLTFTAANWNVPQTVTVTGANDFVQDGDAEYSIVLGAATSADANYQGVDPTDVFVTNTDDDVAGITVTPTAGLGTSESGNTATFDVVLDTEPTADVIIPVASGTPTEGTTDVTELVFTAANWNVPQTVTVTGVNDFVQDGDAEYSIVLGAATSADANYAAMDANNVFITNADDDVAGITVTPTAGLTTTEAGGSQTFTIVLDSEPTGDVTIPVASSDPREGSPDVTSVTFTPADWNVPQTVYA